MREIKAIFIGASAGGISAIQHLLSALDEHFQIPIIIAQHLPADVSLRPSLIFGTKSKAIVSEALEKSKIEKNHIYFAPPGYHLLIEKDFTFSLSQDEPVQHARPSIDVLFEAAARVYGAKACGVLLTGANADGAEGMRCLQDEGAITLVQDPSEAEVPAMPISAIQIIKPDLVGKLAEIARKLCTLSQEFKQ